MKSNNEKRIEKSNEPKVKKRISKSKILKIALFVFTVIIITATIIYLFPIIKDLSTTDGQIKFKQKISQLGFGGILALFGLQLAQIFLIILPGEPIEVLAGVCYGGTGGLIFILVSSMIISALIIGLVGILGRKFIYNFYSEEKIKKIEQNKILSNPKKVEIIMLLLFLIPGTPKDLLVYIAAILPIKKIRFIIISTIARIPSVLSSTLAGAQLLRGNWEISILIYAVTFCLVGVLLVITNIYDKNKVTKEVINTLNKK